MHNIKKEIFGKCYSFIVDDVMQKMVADSVGLYPDCNANQSDVTITVADIMEGDFISKNPSVFTKYEDGFLTHFPSCKVLWKFKAEHNSLDITVALYNKQSTTKKAYSRLRSMEYPTDTEAFQQILHELVLVPSVYFFPDLSIIHAAAISKNGKAILMAGTGGTGKTSALLALRKQAGIGFITDDIAVVSQDGMVYPNLAWPKVYGYNLSSYIGKSELLEGRSLINRLHFSLKLRLNPKTVRRKMRPDVLYGTVNTQPVPLGKVLYLVRDQSEAIQLKTLHMSTAIKMGLHVMKTEYDIFHRQLEWDSYNALAMDATPTLRTEDVFDNWENNLKKVFSQAVIQTLHIPVDEKHEAYLEYISDVLMNG